MSKLFTIFFLLHALSCESNDSLSIYKKLLLELKSRSLKIEYIQTTNSENKKTIKVKRPNLRNTSFLFLEKGIDSKIEEFMNDCNENGSINLDVRVKTLTKRFISMIIKVHSQCSTFPSDTYITYAINVFIDKNAHYVIKLTPTANNAKPIVESIKKKLNEDCLNEMKESILNGKAIFVEGKAFIIDPLYNHFCYIEAQIPLAEEYFVIEKIKENQIFFIED